MVSLIHLEPDDVPVQDNLFQTAFWGKFKTACGQQAVFFLAEWVPERKKEVLGISAIDNTDDFEVQPVSFPLMVLLRKTGTGQLYAYAPRAPEIKVPEELRGCVLEDIALALKEELPQECICIRFDTYWRSAFSAAGKEGRRQRFVFPRNEIQEMRMNFGTENFALRKSPKDHLCADTVLLNLSLPPEQILMRMRQTTRNSIRRSYKSDIDFTIYCAGDTAAYEKLKIWHSLYTETAIRKGFYSEDLPYFGRLFFKKIGTAGEHSGKGPPSYAITSRSEKSRRSRLTSGLPVYAPAPSPDFYLFTAEKGGILLAGMIMAICGKNAYYMYAASNTYGREYMPNYGIQWEAVRFARMKGCTKYDLLGIPPNNNPNHPMNGLYTFKTGLGGDLIHFCGCWDYPFNGEEYNWFRTTEQLKN